MPVWSYHRTSYLSLFEVFCTFHIQTLQLLTEICLLKIGDNVCQKTFQRSFLINCDFVSLFVYVSNFLICLRNRNDVFSLCLIFVPQKHSITLRLENRMAKQADQINLVKVVFDETNSERKSWTCIGHSCSISLIVFLSQFFVIFLVILGSFWRVHLSESCDDSAFWVGILCSAAGIIVPTSRLSMNSFPRKIEFSSL